MASLYEKYAALLAAFPNAEGSKASAQVVSSGEAASVKLTMNSSVGEGGGESTISASVETETDGVTLSASGDAAATGDTASTSLELNANLQADSATVQVIAEAEGNEAETNATASIDPPVEPETEIFQDTVETPDNGLSVESRTYLETIWNLDPLALEPSLVSVESAPVETGDVDLLF